MRDRRASRQREINWAASMNCVKGKVYWTVPLSDCIIDLPLQGLLPKDNTGVKNFESPVSYRMWCAVKQLGIFFKILTDATCVPR